ncbi:hypothetical protein [Streptomyces olivaceus]
MDEATGLRFLTHLTTCRTAGPVSTGFNGPSRSWMSYPRGV